jgi:hypothetical protein
MRGKIVYQLHDNQRRVIGYCGRDPDFERKHAAWVSGGRQGNEPVKVTFPKGLHRGLVLYGEHRLGEATVLEHIQARNTLVVVEGPNDAIRLSLLGIPAVAILGNHLTEEQADKLAQRARQWDSIPLTLMFDLDPEGETGMQQAVWELAQRVPIRVGWSRSMFGGSFNGRQPESLAADEWRTVQANLMV